MNKKNLIWFVVVLLIVVGGIFIYKSQKKAPVLPVENTNPIAVVYYCQEGILKTVYNKNDVALSLADGRNLVMPQVISGSGIRYQLGDITFWSKGDNAFLTEGDKQTYTNCVAGTQTTNKGTNTYTDASKTFSFSYPSQFVLSGSDVGYSQDWMEQTTDLGLLLAVVNIPKSLMPGTNFGESKFTVGTSADPDAVKNCLVYTNGNLGAKEEVTIGNTKFTKITFSDAGAGNFYETTSYRTIRDNQCYAVEYTIHSSNIYNYSPDQGIKEFDKAKVTSILESMAQSFKFL